MLRDLTCFYPQRSPLHIDITGTITRACREGRMGVDTAHRKGTCRHRCNLENGINSFLTRHIDNKFSYTFTCRRVSMYIFHSDRHCRSFLHQTQQVDALGPLDGETQSAIPDELDERTQSTADTEGDGVVQRLLEAVVVEEDAGGGVDVGVGVLGLSQN